MSMRYLNRFLKLNNRLIISIVPVRYLVSVTNPTRIRSFSSSAPLHIDNNFSSLQNANKNSPQTNQSVTITERCLKRCQQVLEPDELLRVGVRGGGCSGFEYEFSVEKRSNMNPDEDLLFEEHVIIDRESLEYLIGSKVDYEDELIRSGFCIADNPQAEQSCSCGVSFSLKMDKIEFK